MPIYEYQCNKCATIFEEWLNSSESDSLQTCPNCQEKAQRIVSQTSFVLKGSGWYVSEYGKNSASSNPAKKNDIPHQESTKNTLDAHKGNAENTSSAENSTASTENAGAKAKPAKEVKKAKETKK